MYSSNGTLEIEVATQNSTDHAKFRLGRITVAAEATRGLSSADINQALVRHRAGDWGETDNTRRRLNEEAIRDGKRIVSSYRSSTGIRFCVITEWDRSRTTITLSDEK